MLILGIGRINHIKKHNLGHRCKQAGFTLVEVMVALFIMGLMAGAVILNMSEPEDMLTIQAKKMTSHLKMAAQMSLIEQIPLGVTFSDEGYSLVKYDDDEWTILKSYTFGEDQIPIIALSQNGAQLDFEAIKKSTIPVIRYDTTGLATPFVLSLGFGGDRVKISGLVDGSLTLEENGG